MDMTFADCLRVGHGYDVHALAPGLRLRLCGVDLEHDKGCVAHSDGDVAVHALCDALLGAAALGDIGLHFPDTAAEYAGIDSMVLLERCMAMLAREGFGVVNADVTVAMQRPGCGPTSTPCAGGWPRHWEWSSPGYRSRRPPPSGSVSWAAKRGWRPMPWC